MRPSEMFRALFSVGSVSLTAVALLGPTPARALTINLPVDVTCTWNDSTKTLNCSSASPSPSNPGSPTNCSLAASPASLSAAGEVTLTAACQGTVTGYAWSASPSVSFTNGANTTGTTNKATISANTTFTLTASNANGSAQAVRTVQVGAVVGGITCPGFSKTLVVPWDWGVAMSKIDTYQVQQGLGTNGILVVPFKPTLPEDNVVAQITAVGYPSPTMENVLTMSISTVPCDLNPPAPARVQSPGPVVRYVVGTSPISVISGKPTAASLTAGVQYYINIAGRMNVTSSNPSGTQTCVPGINYPNCDFRLGLSKPSVH